MPRALAVIVMCCASFAAPAAAQFAALEKVLANVEDVGIFYLYGGFEPRSLVLTTSPPDEPADQTGLNGFGFEVSIGVLEVKGAELPPSDERCKEYLIPRSRDTTEITETLAADTTKLVKTSTIKTVVVKPKGKCKETKWSGELALGYSQIKGFEAQDTTFELRAAVRELPSIAFYVTYKPEQSVSPYIGIRSGIIQLHGLRAYSDSTVYSGSGSTFQAGIAVGVVAEIGAVQLFAEPSYNVREFSSVEWTPVGNIVPLRFPRSLKFDSWMLALGIQVPLSDD